jgi:hypothetical protein
MLKYKETSLQIFIPNKNIDESVIDELFSITHDTVMKMLKNNTFKAFQISSTIASNIEIKGEFFSTYSISGFLPPHTINSILNLFKFIIIHVGGRLALNHEFIEDLEVKWENFETKNPLFKILKANERIKIDVEMQKGCFDDFCKTLQEL